MVQKKLSIEKANGVVVSLNRKAVRDFYDADRYLANNRLKIGISFVTVEDRMDTDRYLHVLYVTEEEDDVKFNRFPIDVLKRSRRKVSEALKDSAVQTIKSYLKANYLDNLSYIEAFANIKKIKTR